MTEAQWTRRDVVRRYCEGKLKAAEAAASFAGVSGSSDAWRPSTVRGRSASCTATSGGGTSGTGGGSANPTALCTRIGNAVNRFFAGQSACGFMGVTLGNSFTQQGCLTAYPSCTSFDLQAINAALPCLEQTTPCTSGSEAAALQSIQPCAATLSDVSPGCQAAIGIE